MRWTPFGLLAVVLAFSAPHPTVAAGGGTLEVLWTHETGVFDGSAAEIVAFDRRTDQLFVTNSDAETVDVLDVADGSLVTQLDVSDQGNPNSVAVRSGLVAVAVENGDDKTQPGFVVFFSAMTFARLNVLTVGALPDMLTFSPNGRSLLVANEGEPSGYEAGDVDPEGSISIIDVRGPATHLTQSDVCTAGFSAFNADADDLRAAGIRIFGPGATVAQDLEPEYIAVSDDSRTAYVTLQENNALAVVDIRRCEVTAVLPLGTKDHGLDANALDASDKDDAINIQAWPVRGMYQPDAIAYFRIGGKGYLLTANEGDARDYDGFAEEERVEDLTLDPTAFPNASTLQERENLGRLTVTTANGDSGGDGDYDELFAFGARSFSVWSTQGELVYDSGDALEQLTGFDLPDEFNATNDENDTFDNRSDNKGPEPEAAAIGHVGSCTYAFIGLERIGGIVVIDVTNPEAPEIVDYLNNRDFTGDAEAGTAGDLGPEGMVFIPRSENPLRRDLLAVANEVSGTTTLYAVNLSGRCRGCSGGAGHGGPGGHRDHDRHGRDRHGQGRDD